MLCPECGEVIGSGPLDLRHPVSCERNSAPLKTATQRFFAELSRLIGGVSRAMRAAQAD